MFDERFWERLDTASQERAARSQSRHHAFLRPSQEADVLSVGEETWVDCGTPESLLQASQMAKDGKLDPTPHR